MNQLIHLRLEPELKKQINIIVNSGYYGTATDFIKEQIRKGIFEFHKQSAFSKFRGIAKTNAPLTQKDKILAYEQTQKRDIFKEMGLKVSEREKIYSEKQNH